MPIDDPVKKLVHDVLFREAKNLGPKALAAEAELRARGDFARADMARLSREFQSERLTRFLYSQSIVPLADLAKTRNRWPGLWDSPA